MWGLSKRESYSSASSASDTSSSNSQRSQNSKNSIRPKRTKRTRAVIATAPDALNARQRGVILKVLNIYDPIDVIINKLKNVGISVQHFFRIKNPANVDTKYFQSGRGQLIDIVIGEYTFILTAFVTENVWLAMANLIESARKNPAVTVSKKAYGFFTK